MGPDRTGAEGLTARCPTCSVEHHAGTLAALSRLVETCCRKRADRRVPVRILPQADPSIVPPQTPYRVVFDRGVLSQNKTTYAHWSKYKADCEDWLLRVRFAFAAYRGLVLTQSAWTLVREYTGRERPYDYGNLVGGAKPIPDALITCGVIKDDAPKYFTCTYSQVPGSRARTLLTLESYTR